MSDTDHALDVEEEQELDLSNSDVVTKYKAAAEICNKAIAAVVAECKPGVKLIDICSKADAVVEESCAGVFKGKNIEKGIAFPACVSLNHCVGHNCPMPEDTATLQEGDIVKIDLGCHIDGFIAVQATTTALQPTPIKGRAADALAAANTCFEAALRLIRPGKKIADVAEPLGRIVKAFDCNLVEGVMTHQLKQFIIDGNKCVLNKPSPEHKVEDGEFEENEVYAIDIVVSTGEGKARVLDEKETNVYKRALDTEYNLKMKASRAVFSEINKRFPTMPFSLRLLKEKTSRFGLVECLNHGLLHAYPVLYEKQGEIVVHIKGTVLLMPNGSDKITTAALPPYETDKAVADEDLKELLRQSLKKKKAKKAKDGKKKEEAA